MTAAGLRFAAAGSGPAQWFPALAKRIRGVPGDGLPAARILPYFVPRLFGEIAATDMIATTTPCSGRDRHNARTR